MTLRAGGFRGALVALACVAPVLVTSLASADVFRPAYLEIRELGDERYDVLLKVPSQGDELRLALDVRFPEAPWKSSRGVVSSSRTGTRNAGASSGAAGSSARRSRSWDARPASPTCSRVSSVSTARRKSRACTPGSATFVVEPSLGLAQTAVTYLVLGVEHILGGIDHLLFVLSLLLIVRGFKRIAITITAFTLAHSLTLAAATLGFVHVPGPPGGSGDRAQHRVRRRRGRARLARRAGAHRACAVARRIRRSGCCTASASRARSRRSGCRRRRYRSRCFTFNVGVELGQLLFVAARRRRGCALRAARRARARAGARGCRRTRSARSPCSGSRSE